MAPWGKVVDLLFDDASRTVRLVVVETGNWWADHRVLIPGSALGHPNTAAHIFPVNLTMAQVKGSPDVDTHRPVSRQFESSAYDYYGFSPYWGTDLYMSGFAYWGGMVPMAPSLEMERREEEIAQMMRQNEDANLRSVTEISGYHIHATDGDIGHLLDVLIEDTDWSLRYLIVNTSNWWQGKEVLISPRSTQSIRWTEQLIYLGVTRDRIRTSPAYDADRRIDAAFEADMASHYGPTKPADAAIGGGNFLKVR
ncbi:PRC-barrel domain-containing protein [Cypionkella sp. TWP1-2-1b2]|uniref:PRC-barrel domain-containing protein n=1 Tax=Cypionkella sp. TWP1-2-1b2 TaxID=2804675 RepID=UPI003CEC0C0C